MSGPKHGTIYDSRDNFEHGKEYLDYKDRGYSHHTDYDPLSDLRSSYNHDGHGNRWENHLTDQRTNTHINFPELDGPDY